MSVSLLLGLVYLTSELLLTVTRRSLWFFLQVERRIATLLQLLSSCIVTSFAVSCGVSRAAYVLGWRDQSEAAVVARATKKN